MFKTILSKLGIKTSYKEGDKVKLSNGEEGVIKHVSFSVRYTKNGGFYEQTVCPTSNNNGVKITEFLS